MTTIASTSRMPIPCSESSNACAVPEKLAVSVAGTCSSRIVPRIVSIACERETPGLRSNENVTEGN